MKAFVFGSSRFLVRPEEQSQRSVKGISTRKKFRDDQLKFWCTKK